MKALIFGADGQLGQALQRALPADWTAFALGRNSLDIRDDAAIDRAIKDAKPDIVINAAAYTAVDAAEENADEAYRINGRAPEQIAAACAKHGARFAHISTDYVFHGESGIPSPPDAATNPVNIYGASKRAGEQAVLAYDDALIVRTSSLYSAHGRNFATTMLRLLVERDAITVVSDQISVPTHASSLARAIWTLAANQAAGIHHFTDTGTASWYHFACTIAERAQAKGHETACTINPVTTAEYGAMAARPPFSVLDCAATWAITGTPKHWEEELDIMLAEWMAAR